MGKGMGDPFCTHRLPLSITMHMELVVKAQDVGQAWHSGMVTLSICWSQHWHDVSEMLVSLVFVHGIHKMGTHLVTFDKCPL